MKFSIVTITHNRAHLLVETIKSVLNQTYREFEHIIIDDGSTDNTAELIASFNDKRIKYFRYEKSGLRSFLRNEGIRKSEGDVVCILDSDDLWEEDKLSVLFSLFNKREEVVFAFHNVSQISDGEVSTEHFYRFKTDFFRNVLDEVLANHILPYPFYSFRKSILEKMEMYDENMIDGQHDFFLRIASEYPLYFISRVLSYRKYHSENLSHKKRVSALLNIHTTLEKLRTNNKITRGSYKSLTYAVDYKIGKFYIENGQEQKGLTYINKVLRHAPLLSRVSIKSRRIKHSIGKKIGNGFSIRNKINTILNIDDYQHKRFYSGLIKKNDLCFDIGANIGSKSKLFLSLGARVVAFEPQSACAVYLEKIRDSSFTYLPIAVGAKNTMKELHLASHIEVATFSDAFIDYFKNDTLKWAKTETVVVKKLDTLVQEYGTPSFCKIDVEGYELEILSGLTHEIPLIEFEFTGGFIPDTIKIIKILDKGHTVYNFNLNETPEFELENWATSSEMISIVEDLPIDRLHGNIFVKNI